MYLAPLGSDDPDKCLHCSDDFRPDWMNMRMRKHDANHGSSSNKLLTVLPPPPMAPNITTSILQSNEANYQRHLDHKSYPIAAYNQDDAIKENIIGEEILQ